MNRNHSTSMALLRLFLHYDKITLDDYKYNECLYNCNIKNKRIKSNLIYAIRDFSDKENDYRNTYEIKYTKDDEDGKAELYTTQCQMIRFSIEIMNKLINDCTPNSKKYDLKNVYRINKALGGEENDDKYLEFFKFIKEIKDLVKIKNDSKDKYADYFDKYIESFTDSTDSHSVDICLNAINLYFILDENRYNDKPFDLYDKENFLKAADKAIISRLLKGDYFKYHDENSSEIKSLTENEINYFYDHLRSYGEENKQQDQSISSAADMIFINIAANEGAKKRIDKELIKNIKNEILKEKTYSDICNINKIYTECTRRNLIYTAMLDYFFCCSNKKGVKGLSRFRSLTNKHDPETFYEEIADLLIHISKILDLHGFPYFTLRADTDIRLFSRILSFDYYFDTSLIKDFDKFIPIEKSIEKRTINKIASNEVLLGFQYGNELYYLPYDDRKYSSGLQRNLGNLYYSINNTKNGHIIFSEFENKYGEIYIKRTHTEMKFTDLKLQKIIKINNIVNYDRNSIIFCNNTFKIEPLRKADSFIVYDIGDANLNLIEIPFFNIYSNSGANSGVGKPKELFFDYDTKIVSFIRRNDSMANKLIKKLNKNEIKCTVLNNKRKTKKNDKKDTLNGLCGQALYILIEKNKVVDLEKVINEVLYENKKYKTKKELEEMANKTNKSRQ